MTTSLNFFEQYHSTVIKALGEDAKKVNARVGSIFADNWADKAGNLKNNDEFAKSFENYLKNELEFAKHVITKGVDKPGTVGECLIKFELE